MKAIQFLQSEIFYELILSILDQFLTLAIIPPLKLQKNHFSFRVECAKQNSILMIQILTPHKRCITLETCGPKWQSKSLASINF